MLRTASLSHVIDIPVVTQPQVPMFPKVKSTTEIPQVPFMMVHRWLPLGTGGSISQLFHNTKYQRSRQIQRRSRLLKSSSLVDESIPRERHGPPRETGPEDPQGCCRSGLQLPVIQKPKRP